MIKIIGNYITKFGELWDKSLEDLLREAVEGAIANANLEKKQIEAVFIGNMAGGSFNNQRHLNALVSSFFPHFPPTQRVEAACASGSLAVLAAEHALLAGIYKTVLVVGAEKMTDLDAGETTEVLSTAADNSREYGNTFPGLYAIFAKKYATEFGLSRQELSHVSMKNHNHGLENNKAHFQRKFNLEQISNSPMVADPLRLLDCSPISDGAAAIVLTTKKIAKAPEIIGFGQGQASLDLASRPSLVELQATVIAAKKALKMSGINHSKVEVVEVHDCFTIAEILAIEDLGFFKKGKGGKAAKLGQATYGGKIVVNPSGGLKACGHPVGATGVKQLAYLAEKISEEKFSVAMSHNVGGSGATAIVHIIKEGM